MIKKSATVVSWKNGVALIDCDIGHSCNNCMSDDIDTTSSSGCLLKPSGLLDRHTILISSEQLLISGQRVIVGIPQNSLLKLAIAFYLLPLAGLFISGWFFQSLFNTDFFTVCGVILGYFNGLLITHYLSTKFSTYINCQPVIVSIEYLPIKLNL